MSSLVSKTDEEPSTHKNLVKCPVNFAKNYRERTPLQRKRKLGENTER